MASSKMSVTEAERRASSWMGRFLCVEMDQEEAFEVALFAMAQNAETTEWLIDWARSDADAFSAVCKIAAGRIEALSADPVLEFAAHVLRQATPKKNGGRSERYRNSCVQSAIFLLEYFGYRPITRNDASPHTDSACDIVSRVATALGFPMSFDVTRQVWKAMDPLERAMMPCIVRAATTGAAFSVVRRVTPRARRRRGKGADEPVTVVSMCGDDAIPLEIFGGKLESELVSHAPG